MHPCIRRSIIDKHLTIFISNPTISKKHVTYITDPLFSHRCHEITTRSGNKFCRVIQGSHIHIKYITQSGSTSTYPMSQMQPTFRRFYRMRTFSILHLFNGMIIAVIYNLFLFHFCMGHVVHQSPTNTATASGINKSILRTGIKGIVSIYKFRMKHYITLLASGF